MREWPGALLALAVVAVAAAFATSRLAERRLNAMEWQDFAMEAHTLADAALSMAPDGIEAANRSAFWFGNRCQAVARTTVTEPETGRPVDAVLSFAGHCHQGMPVGAVVLQARTQGQTNDTRIRGSGFALPSSALSLGLIGTSNRPGAEVVTAARAHMDRLLDVKTIQAGALPGWPEGAISPTLPAGLKWQGSIQRDEYLAVRAANVMVICLHAMTLYCAVQRPDGQPGMVQIAAVEGLMGNFALAHQADAVDALTGVRPAPTERELAAIQARNQARLLNAIEDHFGFELRR